MPGGSDPLFWGPVGVRTPPRHPPRLPEGPGLYPTTAQGGPGQVRRRAPATVRGQGQGWPSPPAQPPHGGRQVRPDLSVCEAASRVRPALQGLRGQEGPGRDQGGRSAQRAWAPLGGGGQHWMPLHRCHLARSCSQPTPGLPLLSCIPRGLSTVVTQLEELGRVLGIMGKQEPRTGVQTSRVRTHGPPSERAGHPRCSRSAPPWPSLGPLQPHTAHPWCPGQALGEEEEAQGGAGGWRWGREDWPLQ